MSPPSGDPDTRTSEEVVFRREVPSFRLPSRCRWGSTKSLGRRRSASDSSFQNFQESGGGRIGAGSESISLRNPFSSRWLLSSFSAQRESSKETSSPHTRGPGTRVNFPTLLPHEISKGKGLPGSEGVSPGKGVGPPPVYSHLPGVTGTPSGSGHRSGGRRPSGRGGSRVGAAGGVRVRHSPLGTIHSHGRPPGAPLRWV